MNFQETAQIVFSPPKHHSLKEMDECHVLLKQRVTSRSVYLRNHCSKSHSVDYSRSGTATSARGTSSEPFCNPNEDNEMSPICSQELSLKSWCHSSFLQGSYEKSLRITVCCLGLLLFHSDLDSSEDNGRQL